jgi:hypothetical protein
MADSLKQGQTEQPRQVRDDEVPRLRLLMKCEWSSEEENHERFHEDVETNQPHGEVEGVFHER